MRFAFVYLLSILLFLPTACADKDQYVLAQYYIEQYKQMAIDEMFKMAVPASIKLAQGMLESDFGQSRLANNGKNHFGIKCKSYWEGDTILIDDDAPQECFRRYNSVEESYIDHSFFLRYHPKHNYDHLFSLNKRDYLGWAWGLQDAGYATNPHYADALINLIEKYELFRFDDYEQFYPKGSTRPAVILPDESGYYAIYEKVPAASGLQKTRAIYPSDVQTVNTTTIGKQTTHQEKSNSGGGANIDKKQANHKSHYMETAEGQMNFATTKDYVSSVANPNTPYYIANGKFIARSKQQDNVIRTQNDNLATSTTSYEDPLSVRQLYVNGNLALLANREISPIYISYYYGIEMKYLYSYNEMQPGDVFKAGCPVFLEPKSKKVARGQDVYIARAGESLYDIAQRFGVKLRTLQKNNRRYAALTFVGGERVKLQ